MGISLLLGIAMYVIMRRRRRQQRATQKNISRYCPRVPRFSFGPGEGGGKAALHRFSDYECFVFFRFKKEDIPRLQASLGVGVMFEEPRVFSATGEEALLLLLRRLSYPGRYSDLEIFFNRSSACESSFFVSLWVRLLSIVVLSHSACSLECHSLASPSQPSPVYSTRWLIFCLEDGAQ